MTDHNNTHFRGRHYAADHIAGPVPFLNPTTRVLPLHKPQQADKDHQTASQPSTGGGDEKAGEAAGPVVPGQEPTAPPYSGVYHIWRSRDNRKGRHALVLTPTAKASTHLAGAAATHHHQPPRPLRTTATTSATLQGISRMLLRCPVWDVSYDVAAIFTLGSVVWVLNGFFVLLPAVRPAGSWPGESAWGGGVSAVVGATIFEVGSVLLMLEAVNENRSDCFGWALEEALGGDHSDGGGLGRLVLRREKSRCRHHHRDRSTFLKDKGVDGDSSVGHEQVKSGNTTTARKWTWWPSWHELRTHYFHEIGFLACLSQMVGATIFWISGFTGLPQVLGVLTVPAENGIFWLPQVSLVTARRTTKNLHVAVIQDGTRPTRSAISSQTTPTQEHLPQVPTSQLNPSTNTHPPPSPGHRRHRLHNLLLALHARDPAELVHALPEDARLAHRPLEPHRCPGIHPLRRAGLRQRLLAGLRDGLAVVHLHRVVGLPGTFVHVFA